MGTVLITGASGFIGRGLAVSMAENHKVICMSRKDPGLELPWIKGTFGSFEDLRQLDGEEVDVVVHLGAVTGGCAERDGIVVNVEGTRCLMRYLMDRGSRKFVMASSIAAVGMQNTRFRPLQLPIPDEHPCLDRDGYGFGKYMMEEVTRYLPEPKRVGLIRQWALGGITVMARQDAVKAFAMAAESDHKPGVRVMNASAPRAWVADPVGDILRNWWGEDVDASYFDQPGCEFDSVYDVSKIRDELGFVAEILP